MHARRSLACYAYVVIITNTQMLIRYADVVTLTNQQILIRSLIHRVLKVYAVYIQGICSVCTV